MGKTFMRRVFNRMLHMLARSLPGSTSLRPFLHKLRGVKIHGKVFIGDDVYLESEYPECVEIHDGATIGIRSTLIAHHGGPGRIIVGRNAAIMTACTVVSASGRNLTIGEGSVISAGSVVQNSIPPFTLCAGPRIKAVAKITVPLTVETSHQDFVRGLRPLRSQGKKEE